MFQEFRLVNGTWDVPSADGKGLERVRPQDIRATALLTIEGELDDISGAGQTKAAHDLCTGIAPASRQHLEVKGAGHYGIFSGRRWRETVYPAVREFILGHHLRALPAKVASNDRAAQAVTAKRAAVKAPARRSAAAKRQRKGA